MYDADPAAPGRTHDPGSSTTGGRHAGLATVEKHQRQGVVAVLPVVGTPAAQIRLNPAANRISLLVAVTGDHERPAEMTLAGLANLTYTQEAQGNRMWHCLDVRHSGNLPEAYSVLCNIADRVQLDGMTLAGAVRSCVSGLRNLLAGPEGLTAERQVGLFGELCALASVLSSTGPGAAVLAWNGADAEEHDFALPSVDVEVKTTTSEARHHWISSLTQLLPKPGRHLYLLSLQITAAGLAPGARLPEIVSWLRGQIDEGGNAREIFEASLFRAGYSDRHAELYDTRWILRTAPTFYDVDDTFPALTAKQLASLPQFARLIDVRYRIDLSGLQPAPETFHVEIPRTWEKD